jgi:hypothetical protein
LPTLFFGGKEKEFTIGSVFRVFCTPSTISMTYPFRKHRNSNFVVLQSQSRKEPKLLAKAGSRSFGSGSQLWLRVRQK